MSLKEGTNELAACLTLVAPSGMTEAERGQWIAVARQALKGIPADLMRHGCEVARRKCRFPSEIVPTILEEVQPSWDRRIRLEDRAAADRRERMSLPAPLKPDRVDPAAVAAILAEFGHRPGGQV